MKDKIAQWNEMLLFLNEIKKIYSPMPGFYSVYLIRVLGVSWGVCRSFLLTKWRLDSASKALYFLAEIRSYRWIAHLSPFPVGMKKSSLCRSNSNDFCFTTGAFNFQPHLVPVLSTKAQLEISISHCRVKHFRPRGSIFAPPICEFWRPRVQLQPLIW